MTLSYEATGRGSPAASPFPAAVALPPADAALVFSVLDKVARAACHGHAGSDGADPRTAERVARAGAVFRLRLVPSRPVPVDAVLDLAAELVESADALLAAGLDLESLALEGVSGRLTELLLGAGPFEGTPLGDRR